MTTLGWKEGQSLGNRFSAHVGPNDVERLAAARVGMLFKDDNLGLGAKKRGKDVEAQRTGLDAFQGLLGRLNGKEEEELKREEKKVEDRRLEMYVRGRWGGMVFVRGELLVGDMKDKKQEKAEKAQAKQEAQNQIDSVRSEAAETKPQLTRDASGDEAEEKQRKREEKRQRKEHRRRRREEKVQRKAAKKARQEARLGPSNDDSAADTLEVLSIHKSPLSQPGDEPVSSSASENENRMSSSSTARQQRKRRRSSTSHSETERVKAAALNSNTQTGTTKLKNGRHLLRGRNIQAKKMAFMDSKGLNEIFMR